MVGGQGLRCRIGLQRRSHLREQLPKFEQTFQLQRLKSGPQPAPGPGRCGGDGQGPAPGCGPDRGGQGALKGSSQLLSAVGSYRDIRAMLCEEMVFKTLVPKEGEIAAFAKGTKLDAVAGRQLIRLKTVAGSFAIAGSTIMVGLDAFDATRAWKEERWLLMGAYITRAFGGASSIAGVAISMRNLHAIRWATAWNLVGLVLTVASTVAIEMLRDKEWQAWFKSQPFRIGEYASDGSLVDGALKPTPHKSQKQMISRLDDALKEAKGD